MRVGLLTGGGDCPGLNAVIRAVTKSLIRLCDAQVVGLVFDGNIESLGGNFGYDGTANRAIAVHSEALIEALGKIYGADRIVRELRPAGGAGPAKDKGRAKQ